MRRILVVDDEYDIANVLTDFLTEEGYEVQTASNGEEALQLIRDQRPDLIALDMMMPVMTGEELLEALRRPEGDLPVPVIVMSAGEGGVVANRFRCAFVRKPFDFAPFLSLVASLVGRPDAAASVPGR